MHTNAKNAKKKIEEKHEADLMDLSDFENASVKKSLWVFFNKLFSYQ